MPGCPECARHRRVDTHILSVSKDAQNTRVPANWGGGGKRENGRFSLRGVVSYLVPIPFWQYLVGVPLLFVVLGLIFKPMKAVDGLLRQTLFAWVPALESGLQAGYSREALIVTYVLAAIFVAVLGPIVQELYFD